MKIRTDFVTNSSSSSYCVSLSIKTNAGKNYDLRIDPHEMYSSGGDSSIYLHKSKYEDIRGAKDIEELCDLIFASVNLEGEFDDDATYYVCEYYGMDDECDFYEKELNKAKTSMDKLKVMRKIRDDYYARKITEIEQLGDVPKEKGKKIQKIQKEREEGKGPGLARLFDELEGFRKQIINEVSSIGEIKNVTLSEEHYAWGEFAAEDFWEKMVKGIELEEPIIDDTLCNGLVFALTRKAKKYSPWIEKIINEKGGTYSPRITKKVDYLIKTHDETEDEKITKANELNIPIISVLEFENQYYPEIKYEDEAEIDPRYKDVLAELKERYTEDSCFEAIFCAMRGDYRPCRYSDTVNVSINLMDGIIEKGHIFNDCD